MCEWIWCAVEQRCLLRIGGRTSYSKAHGVLAACEAAKLRMGKLGPEDGFAGWVGVKKMAGGHGRCRRLGKVSAAFQKRVGLLCTTSSESMLLLCTDPKYTSSEQLVDRHYNRADLETAVSDVSRALT